MKLRTVTLELILTCIYLSQLLSGCYAIPKFTDFAGANRVLYVWSSALEGALFRGAFLIPEGVKVRVDYLRWCKIRLNYSRETHSDDFINNSENSLSSDSQCFAEQLETIMSTEKMFLNCDLKLTDLAERFNNSVDTKMISDTIHRMKGCTFMAYIQSYRIEYAKNLIMNSPELSIKEIAYRCGFNSVAAFTRSFGSIVGCPPSIYKQQMTQGTNN